MKKFRPADINIQEAKQEYEEFKQKINSKTDLKERDDILKHLKKTKHLPLLIPSYQLFLDWDSFALEKPIYGDFVTDLVIGNSKEQHFVLIEFEDATENSLFKNSKNGERIFKTWGQRFDGALSQVTDWFWRLHVASDPDKATFFGIESVTQLKYDALIIIGRDEYIDFDDKRRMAWRAEKTKIDSRNIKILTYDELLNMMGHFLSILELKIEAI